ncbi:sigma-54-dependent Fis family transcriptional regulator [Paraburkholderia caribensis]|uniref:sigma-54-dependent Fis family transcriptional regulator n=1 Tax=Paraburkholderia caribensis TaxID=75105 RepID=UPI001591F173|nr:sigma-54-dependent Fis family transcriptional regulator [Paraburkholderia caribensis]
MGKSAMHRTSGNSGIDAMNMSSHANGVLTQLGQPPAAGGVHPFSNTVRASWERCVGHYGLQPDDVPEARVLGGDEYNDVMGPLRDLLCVAKPEVDRLFSRLASHDYLVSLAQRDGVMVALRCPDSLLSRVTDHHLILGSVWDEAHQGTNGIGTCLKEKQALSVVMDDHFGSHLAPLSCSVSPIFGQDGHLLGALNATSMQPSSRATQDLILGMVKRSARRIENLLFAQANRQHLILRFSQYDDFSDYASELWLAVDGDLVIASSSDPGRPLPIALRTLTGFNVGELVTRCSQDIRNEGIAKIDREGTHGFVKMILNGVRENRPGWNHRTVSAGATVSEPGPGGLSPQESQIESIFGDAPGLKEQTRVAEKLLKRNLPILIQGETGSGKTAMANALHQAVTGGHGNFVVINCASISRDLIESELFGYRPGAFTGAAANGFKGRLVEADGGTLFLDEIGDMPITLQSRLLQVLSEGEFVPVGAAKPVSVSFRLISATLHDVSELVAEGKFREDLYFRLAGNVVTIPPLRKRADRERLIQSVFRQELMKAALDATLSEEALTLLTAYDWPGNIRELTHAARYAAALCEDEAVSVEHLPRHIAALRVGAGSNLKESADRNVLVRALDAEGWNVSTAAQKLGISRSTLHRKMVAMGIQRTRDQGDEHEL